jgi:hypothetical protein
MVAVVLVLKELLLELLELLIQVVAQVVEVVSLGLVMVLVAQVGQELL